MFDLLSTIGITVSATVAVAAFVALFGSSLTQRILIGAGMALWFSGVVYAGAPGTISAPQLGGAVLVPIGVMSLIGFGSTTARARLRATPLEALIAVHAIRVLGILFVLLYAARRLPAPFAPLAGVGDIAIGMTALPIAFWAARNAQSARATILVWNALGLADLILAIGLGATSGSALMGTLPWILIPCFLVPALSVVHLIVFYRILRVTQRDTVVAATA
jgi:hypothetical protein